MEKKRVTYGVFGMMEYQAVIKVGSKNTMKVNFTDGSLTAMGNAPARYSTDNFMVQHAIENSHDFKRGLIKKVSEVGLGGKVKIERNTSTEENSEVSEVSEGSEVSEVSEVSEGSEVSESGVKQVVVHCNDDAKDYLADSCGMVRSRLRNRDDIMEAAAANGVEFVFE